MREADYCLVLCGDTPTSQSLGSAMVNGCIPIRIGSWWRGLCEGSCNASHGFDVANKSHLPFSDQIHWNLLPELDEIEFNQDPVKSLELFFQRTTPEHKLEMRREMNRMQQSWVYGWGNPMESNEFGDVMLSLWQSVVHQVLLQQP
jgi:hypothetical protein